jgi:hypothetical protein
MRILVRYFIVILAVAVGVSSIGIPIVSPSPRAALAQEDPECPPNNDDGSIPSGADRRCIAEEVRSTRAAHVKPVCLDSRALTDGVEYAKHECLGGSQKVWLEAIAQARAIMRLNSAGYANDSSASGVTPNIHGKSRIRNGRASRRVAVSTFCCTTEPPLDPTRRCCAVFVKPLCVVGWITCQLLRG